MQRFILFGFRGLPTAAGGFSAGNEQLIAEPWTLSAQFCSLGRRLERVGQYVRRSRIFRFVDATGCLSRKLLQVSQAALEETSDMDIGLVHHA